MPRFRVYAERTFKQTGAIEIEAETIRAAIDEVRGMEDLELARNAQWDDPQPDGSIKCYGEAEMIQSQPIKRAASKPPGKRGG